MSANRDAWTGRLSEYLDGELDAAERAAFEAHLQGCEACTRTLAELRAVVERAARLEALPPATDLWPAIEARLAPARRAPAAAPGGWLRRWRERAGSDWREAGARRWSFTFPQLAAAAVLLVLISSGTMWALLSRQPAVVSPGRGPVAGAPASTDAVPATFETARYDAAIADLERVLREHRSDLDSTTVRVIEQNLAVIDVATAQARAALAADPANPYLSGHLATQLKRKMNLLRQATSLVAYNG